MKMRQVAIVFAGVLFAAGATSQEGEKPIPHIEKIRKITLITSHHTLWKVSVYPNGAAQLLWGGIGSSGLDGTEAVAPRGSGSFNEVYNLLVPHLKPFGSYGVDMTIRFRGVSTNDSCTYYLDNTEENREIVRKIMHGIYRKAIPADKAIFEKTLQERPFVQGDRPIIYSYGKNADGAALTAAREDTYPEVLDENEKRFMESFPEMDLSRHRQPAADTGGRTPSSPESLHPPVPPTPPESAPPRPKASPYLLPSLAAALAFCAGTVLWLTRRKKMRDTSP